MADKQAPLLNVQHLTTSFLIDSGWYPAVRDVSFTLAANETLALVGESGCGKSVTAMTIMRLLPEHGSRVDTGRVLLGGSDLLTLDEAATAAVRGNRIAMIFQEPMTALNPVLPVGFQVAEPLLAHRAISRAAALDAAIALLDRVGIPAAAKRARNYPHEFSGGMRQRVMIAMALACEPDVLLADEPTTALDVTIQAQVLDLLAELKAERAMGMVLITHSLGVVATVADRVAVMYAGEIVETADVITLFDTPTHPYTEGLLRAIPRADRSDVVLQAIPGTVPAIDRMPAGCRFAPRCPLVREVCRTQVPPLVLLNGDARHLVRCWVRTDATPEQRSDDHAARYDDAALSASHAKAAR
ncbi:MAG: ABC transporter ATP-binding protein [Burkholderiaceae bacterium]